MDVDETEIDVSEVEVANAEAPAVSDATANNVTAGRDGYASDDSMPDLQSVSNSSDSEGDDSDSDDGGQQQQQGAPSGRQRGGRFRRGVEIAEDDGDSAWEDEDMPLETINDPAERTGGRRTRRAEDQDGERDRRHPSQRAAAPNPNAAANPDANPFSNPGPPIPGHPLLIPAPPGLATQFLNLLTRGMRNPPGVGPTLGFNIGALGGMMGGMGGLGREQKDSPANAARIIAGLARVPEGLVRRLERVSALQNDGGKDKAGEGDGAVGGDVGCAICWDRLLDGDGAAFASNAPAASTGDTSTSSNSDNPPSSDPPSSEPPSSDSSTKDAPASAQDEIISLPCAHLFHASCLAPWFARPGQTTCPTCRFDVDPAGVVWYGGRKRGGMNNMFQGAFEMGGQGGWVPFGPPGAGGAPPFDINTPGAHFELPFPFPGVPVGLDGDMPGPGEFFPGEEEWEGDEALGEFGWTEPEVFLGEPEPGLFGDNGGGEGGVAMDEQGGFTMEWGWGPGGMPGFHAHTHAPPPADADEGEGDDDLPPLEPIPGRARTDTSVADQDDDMPPLEPIPVRAPTSTAAPPSSSAASSASSSAAPTVPPTVAATPPPAAARPPSTTSTAPAPPPPANAPPPAIAPNARQAGAGRGGQGGGTGGRRGPTVAFGLDIVFGTLGPVPPPVDLRAAVADAGLPTAPANPGIPPPPTAGGDQPTTQAQAANHNAPTAGAHGPAPQGAAFGPRGVGGVGINAAAPVAGRGGGMGGTFGQLLRGFGGIGGGRGPAQPQPAPAPPTNAQAAGGAQGGAGGAGGLPPGFRGIQVVRGGPGQGPGLMFGPGQPPPHTWTTPVRAATPDNAGAQTNAQAAGTAGAQAQAGQQGGAPPPANTQAAQEQANAQAAAQEFGTAMLRALGLAPPAPAAGDANPQAGAAGAPVPGMQEAAQTLLGGLFGAMGAGAPGALAPGAPGAPGAGVAAGGGAGGTGNGVHVVHGPVMFEFVTGMPMPPANANNDAANAPSNNTADGGQGAGNGAHVHVHQHVHVHGGHDGGHGPHIHFWEPPVAGAGAPPVAGVPGNAQPNANAAGTPNGPGIAQAAARAAARNAQANAPPPPPLEWSPPPAPGPTLRDRVERREREAGLRCCDASCGVGPSDEEPWAETSELGVVPVLRPLSSSASTSTVNANPSSKDGVKEGAERATACAHTFHASCLVSAQRARGGWREPTAAEEEVPVVCSVCRAEGVVPREAWEAGCVPPLD